MDGSDLYLQITGVSGGATTGRPMVRLLDLLDRIVEASKEDGVFKSEQLGGVCRYRPDSEGSLSPAENKFLSTNNDDPPFVVAILRYIGFVEETEERDRYCIRWDKAALS